MKSPTFKNEEALDELLNNPIGDGAWWKACMEEIYPDDSFNCFLQDRTWNISLTYDEHGCICTFLLDIPGTHSKFTLLVNDLNNFTAANHNLVAVNLGSHSHNLPRNDSRRKNMLLSLVRTVIRSNGGVCS